MSFVLGAIGGACAAIAGTLAYGVATPRSGMYGPVIFRGKTGDNGVALTFDDGPHPDATVRLLDVLGELDVKAAFFMIGRNIERAEHVVERAHAEGHIIANHTFEHDHFGTLRPPSYWRSEIDRTNALIERIIGQRPVLFRPPMGLTTPFVHWAATSRAQHMVTWSRRALDGVHTTRERIIKRLQTTVAAGDIVTMHDGIDRSPRRNLDATVHAVKPLVRAWRDRDLRVLRLDQLIAIAPYAQHADA